MTQGAMSVKEWDMAMDRRSRCLELANEDVKAGEEALRAARKKKQEVAEECESELREQWAAVWNKVQVEARNCLEIRLGIEDGMLDGDAEIVNRCIEFLETTKGRKALGEIVAREVVGAAAAVEEAEGASPGPHSGMGGAGVGEG